MKLLHNKGNENGSGTVTHRKLPPDTRAHQVSVALVISILVGTLLGIIEICLFFVTTNRALLMDGFVNVLSLIPGLLSLVTVRISQRGADWKMHYGYRRIETLMILLFSITICGFAIVQVADTLTIPPEGLLPVYGTFITGYAVAAILVQLLLSRYLWQVGKTMDSRLLILDSVLLRGDIAISAIILAGGVLLIFWPTAGIIQTLITLVVILIIFAYGAREGVVAAKELIDAIPSVQANAAIERVVDERPDVFFISEQRIRGFGGALSVELTVEVDPALTVADAYGLSSEIEKTIRQEIDEVFDIHIRVHPAGAFVNEQWHREGD